MVRGGACVRLDDSAEYSIAREYYGVILKTIVSDDIWVFLLHLLQSSAYCRV